MKPKTVLHILNGEVFSGAEQVVITLCKHLDPARYRPHIITLFEGLTAQRARNMGFGVDVVPMTSRWDLRVVKKIRQIARRENAMLLHAHTIRSHLVGALAARKMHIPVIVHIHSPAIQESERKIKNLWNAFIEARLQKRTDRYVIVADSLRKHLLQKGIPDRKITTLRNAIDIKEVIERAHAKGPSIHERLNLHPEYRLIGMVALFRYRKGAQDLLEALKLIGKGPTPYRLIMIGEGEKLPDGGTYLDVLKKMTEDLEISHRVIYVGFQENPLQWVKDLDIFVLPSRFGEGLPMVVLEAMALGVPVVATPVEGTVEVLMDQITGLLPPIEDHEALAEALTTLLSDPEKGKAMAKEAERVVRERHDAPVHAQGMMEIYEMYR